MLDATVKWPLSASKRHEIREDNPVKRSFFLPRKPIGAVIQQYSLQHREGVIYECKVLTVCESVIIQHEQYSICIVSTHSQLST